MPGRPRRLDPGDDRAVAQLLDDEPVLNVYLRSELRLGALSAGTWWAVDDGERLSSLLIGGALVVPWLGDLGDAGVLASVLDRQRTPQLITGLRAHVHALHRARRPAPALREVRDPQPVMLLHRGGLRRRDGDGVRRAGAGDLDRLVLASAAMHREEMGVDPLSIDPAGWRQRMATLIDRGWSFVWIEEGEVVFKADLSAWTPDVCQVQGVFVAPTRRGQGEGRRGMSAVCEQLLDEVPAVSLYVNNFNEPALHLYRGLGFEHVADFATFFPTA